MQYYGNTKSNLKNRKIISLYIKTTVHLPDEHAQWCKNAFCMNQKIAKCFSFFSLFRWAIASSVTLSQWFLHKTAAFTLSSVPAH